MKYAIKIHLAADDWIFMTDPKDIVFDLSPVLYDNIDDAQKAAEAWCIKRDKDNFIQVIEYDTSREV